MAGYKVLPKLIHSTRNTFLHCRILDDWNTANELCLKWQHLIRSGSSPIFEKIENAVYELIIIVSMDSALARGFKLEGIDSDELAARVELKRKEVTKSLHDFLDEAEHRLVQAGECVRDV